MAGCHSHTSTLHISNESECFDMSMMLTWLPIKYAFQQSDSHTHAD